ncbi:hypothetical protein K503DRAFT_806028 [Rhizopogon vinicolor AM-OR11-026]|uniref:Uncharacterized protein n=1 Tax=Rhizopogon vinicolor AM-OR11-026 TaxID=1314800 RepID=A0A1B7MFX1_9AGAM|nr:hypothetical protein K503DRAFT_806028 [Rhizopogon vinicolor AM-OR11-026]
MQDLLVLLTGAPLGENHKYEVSFRLLSEDKFYPDAASAVLKIPDVQENLKPLDLKEVMIYGDYYGLFCKNIRSNGAEVDVCKYGIGRDLKVKLFDPEDETMHFRLMLNDRLLVVNTTGDIALYSLVNSPDAIQLTAKFSLPSLPSTSTFQHILFTGIQDHDYPLFGAPLCSSWFHDSACNQLIAISIDINIEGHPCPPCTLYAE